MKIVIIGSAHPLRGGGIATFNERLATEFQQQGHEVTIYTFSLQYPSFLFPGTTQYSDEPAPAHLKIKVCINSINPFNWIKIGNQLSRENPDMIVVRYWMPFMGPCFGTILRKVKKNKHTKIVCIADNVIPHENHFYDKPFTRYFIKPVDSFITMSDKVMADLKTFTNSKPAILVPHPLYDNFGAIISRDAAREKLGIASTDFILLFFGFIRKYKGLDMLIDAMKIIDNQHDPAMANVKLLIAGEFYEDKKGYEEQIERTGIKYRLIQHTDFIADSEVKYYLCAANAVVQPYRNATQSGVTPLAYHFEIPMIVTNVGGLPSMVPDKKVGLVTEPDPASIAAAIVEYVKKGEDFFLPALREEKKKYSWVKMTEAIINSAAIK
jgi:glycosyltransferase involved in cell wall biosynthesis